MARARILTDVLRAVKPRRASHWCALAALLPLVGGVGAASAARVVPHTGEFRLLVILASFPDRPLAEPRGHFVGTPAALVDRMVAYFTEVSSGRLRIVPTLGGPTVTVARPRATYLHRPGDLARDAIEAFAAVATAVGDRAALADANGIVVFFPGPGRESHLRPGDPSDPWSNYAAITPPVALPDMTPIAEACVIAATETPPLSSFGVLCHEFGHMLGLPELYAPGGLPQEGIGVWGLMGQGTWVGRGAQPPHLSAWSKAKLGWLDVEEIDRTTPGVELPAVTRAPKAVRIPAVPGKASEYYLLENRLRESADAKLPGEGLLVWHVDESVGGFRTAQTKVDHKLLHLVEADGRGDLDRGHAAGGNRGDAGDPWRGPPAWRRRAGAALALVGALALAAALLRAARPRALAPVLGRMVLAGLALWGASVLRRGPACGPTTPGMAPYDGSPARVVIRNISPPGPIVRFDVLVAPPVPGRD